MSYLQEYSGRLRYQNDHRVEPHRLPVAIPCRLGDLEGAVDALLDTAADWCVLPPDLADALGYTNLSGPLQRLSSRLGSFIGTLERIPVHLADEDGHVLTVDATWFVSPDWPGPPVLGWKGCLERFRFAMDPRDEYFYFGAW